MDGALSAALRGETLALVRRLAREFMRGQWPRITLALLAMAAVAGATAGNAWPSLRARCHRRRMMTPTVSGGMPSREL